MLFLARCFGAFIKSQDICSGKIGYAKSMIHKAVGFDIGAEVLYDEVRYVVAGYDEARVTPYRLLASDTTGAKVVWASEAELLAIASYVTPRLDTGTPELA